MNSSFDDKAREQLAAHQPEVDIAALWGAMEPAVDALNAKRRKRRILVWWFFGLAGLGLAAGLTWWLIPLQPSGQLPIPEVQVHATEDGTNRLSDQNPASDTPHAPSTQANMPERAAITTIVEAHLQERLASGNQELPQVPTETPERIPDAQPFAPKPTAPDIMPVETEVSAISATSASALAKETSLWNVLPFLPGRLSYLPIALPVLPELAVQKVPESSEPPRSPAFQFSLGLQGGASAAARQLSTEDPGAENLLNLRQRTEQSLEVLQAGLRLGLVHRSGLGLSSGLQWTRIAERMEYRDEVVNQDSVYGIMALAVNPYGDTTPIYGQVPHTRTTSIHKRYFNYYQLLDIPLAVSYQQAVGEWMLGAEAGVFLNLRMRSSGQILLNELVALNLDEAQPELFPSRLGLSYQLGLRASRELWPGVQLSLSPQWRYLPDMGTTLNPVRQRYHLFGMQVGLSYSF